MPKRKICGVGKRQFSNIIKRKLEDAREEENSSQPGCSFWAEDQSYPAQEWELNEYLVEEKISEAAEELYTIDDFIFDSSESDSDIEIDEIDPFRSKFQKEFTDVVKKHNCSHKLIHDLLAVARDNGHPEVPLTAKTLYDQEHKQVLEPLEARPIGKGTYWHRGIQDAFSDWDATDFKDIIVVDIFIDGFPIKRSSRLCGWPILGGIVDRYDLPVLLFGIYQGYGSPKNSDDFLIDFAREARRLIAAGIYVGPNKELKRFKIRAFLADAPARAFLLCVKNHSSKHGCSKCEQVGAVEKDEEEIQPPKAKKAKTTIRYQTTAGVLRTNESFHQRSDKPHHQPDHLEKRTVLEEYLNFSMVSRVPIDSMHCIDLGVTKKFFKLVIKNKGKRFLAHNDFIAEMDRTFVSYKSYVPDDFERSTRTLEELGLFKAKECRSLVLYTGPVVLCKFLDPEVYKTFLKYHCGIRLLHSNVRTQESLMMAQQLLEEFVVESKSFMPTTYNIHNLLHMTKCAEQFGPLESFSNYRYESALFELKSHIKSPTHVLEQVRNCIVRKQLFNKIDKPRKTDNFAKLNIKLTKGNNFGLLSNGNVIEIKDFLDDGLAVGLVFTDPSSFYTEPLDSMKVFGISYVSQQETELTVFRTSEIISKLYCIPFEDGFVMIPILHSIIN
jgi:hypothetical protein